MNTSSDAVALKSRAGGTDVAAVTPRPPRSRRLLTRAASALVGLVVALSLALAAGPETARPPPSGTATLVTAQQPAPPDAERDLAFARPPAAPEPTPAEPVASEPAPAPAEPAALESEPDPCGDALAWVAEAGLPLPPGVGYHCPSTRFAHHGTACWNGSPCRGAGFIAVNLDLIGHTDPGYLRHVVAHEVCHIIDFQTRGWTTEAGADACAAAHGA